MGKNLKNKKASGKLSNSKVKNYRENYENQNTSTNQKGISNSIQK